jgi:hypothetical protein
MVKNLKPNCRLFLLFLLIHFTFFSSVAAQFFNETNSNDNPSKLKKRQLTELKIVPADLTQYDRFGHSVDMDGDYAIIGAYGKNHNAGAAYIFKHEATGWEQKAKLTLSQGEENDLLGYTVAISGDVALVSGRGRKSVYIFEKPEGEWQDATEIARLYPSSTRYMSYFGDALDISGDYVIVGDWQFREVYIYEKPEDGWKDTTETMILTPPVTAGGFGHAVAIDRNFAVIGAYLYSGDGPQSGGAFIYKRNETWEYQSVIRPSDGTDGDIFGIAVGIDGNRIIVGAPNKRQAYVFIGDGEVWNEEDILERSSIYQVDFGLGVAILGDTVIVGSYTDREFVDDAGSVSVFCRNASDWIHVNRIIPGDVHEDGLFGYSVALTCDYALVGSYGSNGDSLLAGQAYIFSDYTVPISSIHEKHGNITQDFYLAQNYPNPFNPKTVISWQLPVDRYVDLSIYNIIGQKVYTLISEKQNSGQHTKEWDASGFPSGIYFYRIQTGDFVQTKRMLLIK